MLTITFFRTRAFSQGPKCHIVLFLAATVITLAAVPLKLQDDNQSRYMLVLVNLGVFQLVQVLVMGPSILVQTIVLVVSWLYMAFAAFATLMPGGL